MKFLDYFQIKKNLFIKKLRSKKINLKNLYKLLKSRNLSKIIKKPKYQALFLTLEWYKKYYGKK